MRLHQLVQQPQEDWGTAPFTFNETVVEAYQELGIKTLD